MLPRGSWPLFEIDDDITSEGTVNGIDFWVETMNYRALIKQRFPRVERTLRHNPKLMTLAEKVENRLLRRKLKSTLKHSAASITTSALIKFNFFLTLKARSV